MEQMLAKQKDKTAARRRRELILRLQAPQHLEGSRFAEHVPVEGFLQSQREPGFDGCDRLWKMDTAYGTIQMGYDPRRGHSFLFARVKTSLLDNASSAHERNLWETQMMREQKYGNENVAYESRRRADSTVLLYKNENKPWTQASVEPYLRRVNMGTLRKTLPFLARRETVQDRQAARQRAGTLALTLRRQMQNGEYSSMAATRADQMDNLREQETLSSLGVCMASQSLLFFRKINLAFDLQKAKMFEYYREQRRRRALVAEETVPVPQSEPGDVKNAGKNTSHK